ncbi:MAG: hypothetical protein R3Y39_09060, partial [Rikenellaceae bacterium]
VSYVVTDNDYKLSNPTFVTLLGKDYLWVAYPGLFNSNKVTVEFTATASDDAGNIISTITATKVITLQ